MDVCVLEVFPIVFEEIAVIDNCADEDDEIATVFVEADMIEIIDVEDIRIEGTDIISVLKTSSRIDKYIISKLLLIKLI